MLDPERLADILNAIDAEHRHAPDDALSYAEVISDWVERLVHHPSTALQIAARAQHFKRHEVPRRTYPMDRPGYLRWRRAAAAHQGQALAELLAAHECPPELRERCAELVAKQVPLSDPEAQALEDAACLYFLEYQLADFAKRHPAKIPGIVRKTWAKMSEHGKALVADIGLPEALAQQLQAILDEA